MTPDEELQIRLEIAVAKREAAKAVDRLRRDVAGGASPDRDLRRRAQAALARVNWLHDQLDTKGAGS